MVMIRGSGQFTRLCRRPGREAELAAAREFNLDEWQARFAGGFATLSYATTRDPT
jgi:hypothetical protein